ncbi:hypothetical protein SAMN04487868_11648 [Marinobacter salarius]|jgi:electron transfer flavoprotein alpha/beta subunit|uniref:HEAT repeat domain-containing protein n=3 Tax=Marinobacter TaxID=2742 RepID=A1U5K7_MARN8|nr:MULTISPECIES: hypothetical protein [Marinobacter]ABM20276.1 hypothetical protein Maqu_3203 [Marinobacter nauticus VT8]KAE8546592.1 hypothetical protein F6453_0833 [Marinobacter nauticus]SFL93881.1 hypothetical protein SAMN04487868_11648 [Marinobacter salarius]
MTISENLISVLLDPSARTDERDDAAMDLSRHDSEAVESALALIACDQKVPETVRASCGESLAEIWIRRGQVNHQVLAALSGASKNEALARLRGN